MAVELVVVIAVSALVVGGLIGYLIKGRDSSNREQIAKLEAELEASQSELQDYRQEVVQQFSDTAEKFKTLDESYHALHRQLATSSVALCGDAGAPLLTAASEPLIAESEVEEVQDHAMPEGEEEIVVSEVSSETEEMAAVEETVSEETASEDATVAEETIEDSVEEEVPTLTDNAEPSELSEDAEPVVEERKIVP